jgi:predicted regulator of Ras-like GTPase activity (Roadblock/LC7/MglB family)
MLGAMDAEQAIADLTEISPQVRDVAVVGLQGAVVGTNASTERAEAIAAVAQQLLETADELHGSEVAQLEAATAGGSVFAIRDNGRLIAATTSFEPTVGLVFYDLKTCLRSIEPDTAPARKRAPRKKADDAEA